MDSPSQASPRNNFSLNHKSHLPQAVCQPLLSHLVHTRMLSAYADQRSSGHLLQKAISGNIFSLRDCCLSFQFFMVADTSFPLITLIWLRGRWFETSEIQNLLLIRSFQVEFKSCRMISYVNKIMNMVFILTLVQVLGRSLSNFHPWQKALTFV